MHRGVNSGTRAHEGSKTGDTGGEANAAELKVLVLIALLPAYHFYHAHYTLQEEAVIASHHKQIQLLDSKLHKKRKAYKDLGNLLGQYQDTYGRAFFALLLLLLHPSGPNKTHSGPEHTPTHAYTHGTQSWRG